MALAGLVNKKNALVPLRKVSVEGTVRGYTASVLSTLEYENDEEVPIEAVFTFPLDASSTVVDFSAVIQDRKIVGRVEEKQKAQETYDDAIASGHSAFLMESEREDVFTITVGNLPPREKAAVSLTFVMELPIEYDGSVRFSVPSVLTPRYSPSSELQAQESINPTAHVTYLPSHHIPYTFSFNLRIEGDIEKVESTTHKLSVNQSTDGEGFRNTRVALAEEHRFDKDLILTISPCHPHQPHAVVEHGSIKGSNPPFLAGPAVTVNYFPDFSAAMAVSELIFVIDQSGSMSGAYIEAAKETLMLFLRSIPDGCYFNIVGFGSSYKFLFQTSAPYDQAHLDQASDYTRAIRADMGGTELFQPLNQIFGMPSIKGLPKQVFVLTDGAVSDTTSVINEVKKNSQKARCFAVGIGAGASTALVKGVADAGRGSSEFVQSHEKMQGKVMQMLKRALSPSLSDVHVNWSLPDGVEVIQTPSKVLPVFSGDRLVIYGFISNSNTSLEEECRATLQGVCGGDPFECSVPFSVSSLPEKDMEKTIHQLATKCIIRELQEEDLAADSQEMLKRLVINEVRKVTQSKKELIIELNIATNVMCQETSFVAVDEKSSEPVQGSLHLQQLPVAVAYDSLECAVSEAYFAVIGTCLVSAEWIGMNGSHVYDSEAESCDDAYLCMYEELPDGEGSALRNPLELQASGGSAPSFQITFSAIVSQQKASGAWTMNGTVASLLSQSVAQVEMMSPIGQQLSELQSSIWATCIVIAWLEVKCADLKDEWEMLMDKAISWIKKQLLPSTLTCSDVLAAARKLF